MVKREKWKNEWGREGTEEKKVKDITFSLRIPTLVRNPGSAATRAVLTCWEPWARHCRQADGTPWGGVWGAGALVGCTSESGNAVCLNKG